MKNGAKKQICFAAQFARLRELLTGFRVNRRGNVAIICALTAIPLISAVGCVIDYTTASAVKEKLQAAADAATLATVSNNSPVVTTAQGMSGNGTVSGGSTYAQNFFAADTSAFSGASDTGAVTKSGMVITATLSFSYRQPTFFMSIIGVSNVTVSGSSTASFTLPTYIDFYLMLDVSGSMSFPSTSAEQARLMAVNPDNLQGSPGYPQGCQFACHFAAQGACGQSSPSNPYRVRFPPWVIVTGVTNRTRPREAIAKDLRFPAWERRPSRSPAATIQLTAAM